MSLALKEMRVDQENTTILKQPTDSNSILAKKRKNKAAGAVPSTIEEQMSTEESKM